MATSVGIFGISGQGKTSSIVINPDGKYDPTNYQGLNPETTCIIESDRKALPFKHSGWSESNKNLFYTSDQHQVTNILGALNGEAGKKYKVAIVDTINAVMIDYEMLESKKLTFDKWADLSKQIYEIITLANTLRPDLVVYLMGHVTIFTDVDGNESKCLVTNGKKLEKIKLESKLPIVLYTKMERGLEGKNEYYFETQANRSTGKSPIGMFEDFLIPNSLRLVDNRIREFYEIK